MSSKESPRVSRLHEALDNIDDAMVLLSLHQVGVYGALVDGPATSESLARRLSLVPHRLVAFLHMAVHLGLLKKSGDQFSLFDGDAFFFSPDSAQGTGLPSIALDVLFGARGRAVEILKGASPQVVAGSGGNAGAQARESFLRYIDSVSHDSAQELAGFVPHAQVGRIIDIGGGGGTYSHAVLRRFGQARGLIIDRPDAEPTVLALAQERGFAGRLGFAAIDFVHDALPSGNDVAILSNIVHCYGVSTNRALVGRVADCLAPGGVVAIKDYSVAADHSGPAGALRFAASMAVNSDQGSVYSAQEVSGWCREAGLVVVETHEMVQSKGSYTVIAMRRT